MLGWCIVFLASARLKASVRFPPLRRMYQKGICKGCDTDLALMLDRINFFVDNNPIDNKRYLLIGKALLRGKEKATLVNNDREDVEDIGGLDGTPSSSTANLDSDDSLHDVAPLGQDNVSHFVSGDFARPNRDVDVLDFDHLNILGRPSSVPAGPSGPFAKRRRVASLDARSPLGRPRLDDDWLRRLKEKIKEQECQQVKMER